MAQGPANPTCCTFLQESFPLEFEGVYRGRCGTWSEQQLNIELSTEEKLLTKNDRRKRDNNNGQYAAIGLLRTEFETEVNKELTKVYSHGTATIIADGRYVLTCAHNLVESKVVPKNKPKKFVYAQNVWFDIRVNKADGGYDIIKRYSVSKCFIYPPYLDNPTCDSGFDLAICVLDIPHDDRIIPEIRQNYGIPSLSTSAHLAKKIAVVGFPEEFKGEKWGMVANVPDDMESDWHQFLYNESEILVYNFVDTTNGQSGSPVMCESGHIIGVHTGGAIAQMQNWATYLASSKMQWIKSCLSDS